MLKQKYLLIIIIFIAAILRFYQLGINPPSLTWDEVAWGYNAYSIGIDGKDEFGRFLPYDYLESFGDFKPPVYAYLDILPVKIFGLYEFAVRFPSALFGVLTVLVTYFLTKAIFYTNPKQIQNSNNKNTKHLLEIGNWKLEIPIIAAALLAVSPWHIMLSRGAFEANVATFFIISGVWMFLEAVQKRPWFLVLSAIFFVLSIYTFNTARVVSPILVIGLAIAFRKELFRLKREVATGIAVGLILLLPTVSFLFSPQASLRFKEVNIFSDIEIIKDTNQQIANDNNAWWSKIIHNRRIAYGREYVKHYFDNLSPSFLFIKGDGNPKFSTQSVGQLYIFELPFIVAGILFLFRKREKNWWIIPFWLLIAIAPAATARETPHALRIETTLPMFQILVAYGIVNLFFLVKKYKAFKLFASIYLLFATFNIAYYLEDYYTHYPKAYSHEWQYGYKDAIAYINQSEEKYSKVYITKEMGRPYIYTLFYKKYDPEVFRKEADIRRDAFGFVTVKSFGKYYFDKDELVKTGDKNVLFVDSPVDVPENAHVLKRFTALDGTDMMVAYTF